MCCCEDSTRLQEVEETELEARGSVSRQSAKGEVEPKMSENVAVVVSEVGDAPLTPLQEIAKRFVTNVHFDIGSDPNRTLLKHGTLNRQATSRKWKTVSRECFLFNDVFIFGHKLDKDDKGKLEMKQVIQLHEAVLDNRTVGKTSMKNGVCINTPEREFVVGAHTAEEKEAWITSLASAIQAHNDNTHHLATVTHQVHLGTIFSAVVLNDMEQIKKHAAQKHFNVDDKDSDGNTALHLAVDAGLVEVVTFLLSIKANPETGNAKGYHAAHLAAAEGHLEVLEVLLKQGVDVDAKDGEQRSVLSVAICEGIEHVADIVTTLVKTGRADLHEMLDGGKTHLHVTAEQNDFETTTALIKLGMSPTREDDKGWSPLHYAAQAGAAAACEVLLGEGAGPNVRDSNLSTALHLCRDIKVANVLVSHGARMDLKNTEDTLASSFFDQDAEMGKELEASRKAWNSKSTAPRDEELCTNKSLWVEDATSDMCQMCFIGFTMTRRRHHCRRCGNLVCGPCSAKKFLSEDDDGSDKSKSKKNLLKSSTQAARACDSCYNILIYKAEKRTVVEAKIATAAKASGRGQEQERVRAETEALMLQNKAQSESNANLRAQMSKESEAASAASAASATASQLNENKMMLQQNMEALKRTEENALKMENEGQNFAANAKKLAAMYK